MNKFVKWGLISLVGLVLLGAIFGKDEKSTTSKKEGTEDIAVVSSSETASGPLSTIHVTLKNNTEKLLTSGMATVIYKDKEGKVVGTGTGAILNLPAGQTKVIDCLAMDVVGADTYEVQVEPMIYN